MLTADALAIRETRSVPCRSACSGGTRSRSLGSAAPILSRFRYNAVGPNHRRRMAWTIVGVAARRPLSNADRLPAHQHGERNSPDWSRPRGDRHAPGRESQESRQQAAIPEQTALGPHRRSAMAPTAQSSARPTLGAVSRRPRPPAPASRPAHRPDRRRGALPSGRRHAARSVRECAPSQSAGFSWPCGTKMNGTRSAPGRSPPSAASTPSFRCDTAISITIGYIQ